MMYMNFSSASTGEFSAGNSQQPNSCIDIPNIGVHDSSVVVHQEFLSSIRESWRDGRNQEMMLMEQMGNRNLQGQVQGQGLSLSLGAHISPTAGMQFNSGDYRNPNLGFSSFLSPDSDSIKTDVSPYGIGNVSRAITDSKYLKAAQQLLDEIVNVGKALKQHNSKKESTDDSKGIDGELNSSNQQESNELSAAEKQDLQNKMTKLISMLDEVDRRYKQYYHQMQIVVSAFDVIAGCGAAKPYTALALQTISRHFRCLRDAINGQIKSTHRSLGETDSTNGKGVGISRLRFVDQKLRQQRALQQLGMMQQHTWRPQRGLPETSVSILRAWLFEHFLHPYPKDSDKIMLSRQTGLTRSQVSNWFINARVRLWKPMVEEMYKEEAGDAEMESNSSSEFTPKNIKGDKKVSYDKGEDNHQSTAASAFESKSSNQPHDVEMVGTSNNSDFQNMMVQSSSRAGHERLMAAAYQMPTRFEIGNGGGVSLTLGLQHCEDGSLPPMASLGSHHHGFVDIRGGGGGVDGGDSGVYEAGGGSSVEPETVDFDCVDSGNRQQKFGSSNLLHDFVA